MPEPDDAQILNQKLDGILLRIEELSRKLDEHLRRGDDPWLPFSAVQRRFGTDDDYTDLSPLDAKLLERLMMARGRLVPTDELCHALGLAPSTQQRHVKMYVSRLRGKLRSMKNPGIEIQNNRGLGYRISVLRTEGDNE